MHKSVRERRISGQGQHRKDKVIVMGIMERGGAVRTQARVVTVDLNGDGWEYRLAFPGIAEPDAERLSRLVALGG